MAEMALLTMGPPRQPVVEVAPDQLDSRGVAAEQAGCELLDDGGDGAAAVRG